MSENASCEVCGEELAPDVDRNKYDPESVVYADEYAYHLGCEDELFDEVICAVPEHPGAGDTDDD